MIPRQDEVPDLFWTGQNRRDPGTAKPVAFAEDQPLLALPRVTDQRLLCENEA
ncbi:hypothetical protein K1W54_30690 [Micromonospora sp. CPCC 205371]|nr:hypothetical protein [Micromonospora sp. CPCC 205371]